MSPVGTHIPSLGSTAPHGGLQRLALQKLKPASGLHGHPDHFAQSDHHHCRKSRTAPGSRSGTDRAVPFRHSLEAPRLDAAFVAQLLGQLMPGERAPAAACIAYGDARNSKPVFDKKL
jgi:hypothetical protein